MDTLTQEQVKAKTETIIEWSLVLYNDDFNTFDHVIDCLMQYCDHELTQAEQCAWIVHTAGKCAVKHGNYVELAAIGTSLLQQGLTIEIE